MYFLPCDGLIRYSSSCNEKIQSYQEMAKIGLPVLKSIILVVEELEGMGEREEYAIRKFLQSRTCMIRYLYHNVNHHIKNGGKIIEISKNALMKEYEKEADFWLLEPGRRENNLLCCNICLNKETGNLHMEFLGEGFDVSDINKGKMQPHEQIDIPYPICYGAYGEWWKWAHFWFCTHVAYQESIAIRKNRLKEFGTDCEMIFSPFYRAVDRRTIEYLFELVEKIENSRIGEKEYFYNLSCSFQKNGRFICWDIQTPTGKKRAFL